MIPARTRLLTGTVDAPTVIPIGSTADAEARRAGALEFETMHDLVVVCGAHSELRFHTWSGARPALPAGATSATLVGHLPHLAPGQVLLLVEHRDPVGEEKAVADADPTRRHAVRLTTVDTFDGSRPAGRRAHRSADHRDHVGGRRRTALATARRG